jgi:transcriptional regulator with XRE-family HTH domain
MTTLVEHRKKIGMSQFLCAQRSGISRMRLSLAETGQIVLTP